MIKIFVDGSAGATGVTLMRLLNERPYEIITADDPKDIASRYAALNSADIAVLCLPEEIATNVVHDNHNTDTIIIDASSAHRTNPDWVYGYYHDVHTGVVNVKNAMRISNPGCFATGIQTLLRPLRPWLTHYPIAINGITGYSAGGGKAIYAYGSHPCAYKATNTDRPHTHVNEAVVNSSIVNDIIFMPAVGGFAEGQLISIPLSPHQLQMPLEDVRSLFEQYYADIDMVRLRDCPSSIRPEEMMDSQAIQIMVSHFENHIVVHALYNNLTAGAAGSVCRIIDRIAA